MPDLVNVSVFDSSCSRTLLSWTVFSLEDDRMTLGGLFDMVGPELDESRVGQTRDLLDRVGDTCKSLASYIGLFKKLITSLLKIETCVHSGDTICKLSLRFVLYIDIK